MKRWALGIALLIGCADLPVALAQDDAAYEGGLIGMDYTPAEQYRARAILQRQSDRPSEQREGELSNELYIKSLERLADTFEHPIPETASESTFGQQ
ncbi:hypothetical protein DET50_12444 [Marinobacter pelagius]|uniref:DUF3613 domain-containing protein n=2 Tax=Marinobacter pelagius TaxID=379482 RepID=A0A366GE51_9GAMM|nr:hypothetical protein DET50_12444 [Marinobacter pelagius]